MKKRKIKWKVIDKSKEGLEVGDFVIPTLTGIMEQGEPPYEVESVNEDGTFGVVQTIRTYQHRMNLKRRQLKIL